MKTVLKGADRAVTVNYDATVIGAGVVGLACALRLAQSGLKIALIDPGAPGSGTSYGNAGHIATEQVSPLASPQSVRQSLGLLLDPDGPLSIRPAYALKIAPWLARFVWASRPSSFARGTKALSALQGRAMGALQDLLTNANARHLLHDGGNLLIAERPESALELQKTQQSLAANGVEAKVLSPEETMALAPGLKVKPTGALLFSGTGHVDDPRLVSAALADAFQAQGGDIIEARVLEILPQEGGGFQIVTDSDNPSLKIYGAARVVIAAGVRSGDLVRPFGHKIPLDTERGYALTFPDIKPDFSIPIASYERNVIMTPMVCGLRLTGKVEFGGTEAAPTPSRFQSLERHADALYAPAGENKIEHWMGFRPTMPDYLPVIGESERQKGVFFAFGHQHLGLTLSAATAEIISDLVNGETPSIDVSPFRASRF